MVSFVEYFVKLILITVVTCLGSRMRLQVSTALWVFLKRRGALVDRGIIKIFVRNSIRAPTGLEIVQFVSAFNASWLQVAQSLSVSIARTHIAINARKVQHLVYDRKVNN